MKRFWIAAAVAIASAPALAADIGVNGLEGQLSGVTDIRVTVDPDGDWSGVVGAGAGFAPEFIGSEDYEITLLPAIDVEWRGAYFFSTQRGLGLNFIRSPSFKAGPRLTYDFGRDSSKTPFLRGLPNVDGSVEFGIFGDLLLGNFRLKSDLRKGLQNEGHNAFILNLDAAYGGQANERLRIIVGAFTHYVSEEYMQKYFDVTVAAAKRPRFTSQGGGFPDLGLYLNMNFSVTERAYLAFTTRGAGLLGDAADSPISQQDLQYFAGLSVGYRF